MKSVAISEFKAHALRLVDDVFETHETIVITKRGKAMAELVPFRGASEYPVPGKLSAALVREGDILSPLDDSDWEANQ
jgi:prevent-host-death family protein